jgi:type IX secretion system PorP/SprF family membrane protein
MALPGPAAGQELPVYQLYLHHPALVNPAVTGSAECTRLTLIDRHQWIGAFKDAPRTQVLTAEKRFSSKNFRAHGLELQLVKDANGAYRQLAAGFGYSFHFALDRKGSLKLGLGLMATVRQSTYDESDFSPVYDPVVTGGVYQEVRPDASTGVYLYGSRFFAGLSAVRLLATGSELDASPPGPGYFAGGGYIIPVSRDLKIQAGLMAKYLAGQFQSDLNARLIYRGPSQGSSRGPSRGSNRGSCRAIFSYRHAWPDFPGKPASILVGGGLDYGNFSFGYAYEAGLSSMQKYGFGSHEFLLGYRFCAARSPCSVYPQSVR